MQAILHGLDGHRLGGDGDTRFLRAAEDRVLQYGQVLVKTGEADSLNDLARRKGGELTALDLQAAGRIPKEKVVAPALRA